METRNISISKDTAERMIASGDEFQKQLALSAWKELAEKKMPTCFEEIEMDGRYYYVDACSNVQDESLSKMRLAHTNTFKHKSQAEANKIFGALIQARDI